MLEITVKQFSDHRKHGHELVDEPKKVTQQNFQKPTVANQSNYGL